MCLKKSGEGWKGVWWFGADEVLEKSAEVGRDGGVDFLVGSGVTMDWKERVGGGSRGGSRGGTGGGSGCGSGGGLGVGSA